jgi:hypothetical protein
MRGERQAGVGGRVSAGRRRGALAYGSLALTALLACASLTLAALTWDTPYDFGVPAPRLVYLAVLGSAVALSAIGSLVLVRHPRHNVGRLFCALGPSIALTVLAQNYAVYGLLTRSEPLPGATAAAWFEYWSVFSCLTSGLALLFLLFPDGHLLTRRWRVAAWGTAAGLALFALGTVIEPATLQPPFEAYRNPFGIEGVKALGSVVLVVGFMLSLVSVAVAAVCLVLRLRRAGSVQRRQIAWLVYAGAIFAVAITLDIVLDNVPYASQAMAVASALALLGIPVAAGVAILRHRLYDIDVVVNRTLVYAASTALLAGAYLGLVLLLQLLFRPLLPGSGLAVALSTLAVAALFRPARDRVQAVVDRRFYRRKYDAARTVEAFAGRLRDEVDLDALLGELGAVVHDTVQPAHVSLWLREAGR